MSNDEKFVFTIRGSDHPAVESIILYSTLIDQFRVFGINLVESYRPKIDDQYLKQIFDKLVLRIAYMMEEAPSMETYYIYYGAYVGYFKEYPPSNIDEVYRVIATAFLSLVAEALETQGFTVQKLKEMGFLDILARDNIKAGLDAYRHVITN